MIPDPLYEAAFQFRKTKLWQRLYDTQIFAVRHADGTIGYCCVMGMMGEHLALAVYPGEEGLASYRRMGIDRSGCNEFETREIALSQNCVMVSFETKDELRPKECQETRTYCTGHKIVLRGKNAWPRFQRFRPYYFPWYVDDETDQAHLLEGLEACLHVASMLDDVPPEALGLTDGAPFHRKIPLLTKSTGGFTWEWVALPKPAPIVYPSPEIHDDLALARLARSAKRGGEWACDIFLHVEPMTNEETEADEEPESAPFYAFLLIILDPKTGMILSLQKADDPEDYTEIFTRAALACAQSQGKPSRVLVCNERTRAFFGKISAQLRAELVYKKRIPCLEEALDEFLAQFTCDEEGSDEDVEQLLEALRDPRALADMPESILIQLRQLIKINEMPEDIAENVMRECKRRGLL